MKNFGQETSMADDITLHLMCGERNWTCVPSTGVPFVVGLSTASVSHRKPEPAEHFVTATVFRDMTKWIALTRIQWR
jgi:hypothetical protein